MNTSVRNTIRLGWAALRALLVLTIVTGVIYPLAVLGVAQTAFHRQADGDPVRSDGRVVGSQLIGQTFTLPPGKGKQCGEPDPRWFQPRPSVAGACGYDPTASGASNLGPTNPALVKTMQQRRVQVAAFNGVAPSAVPVDAVTASASGLDPDISPQYARIQADRVARARHLPVAEVENLVTRYTQGRELGFLGQPTVNVLDLNVALQGLST